MLRKLSFVALAVLLSSACLTQDRDSSYDVGNMALRQGHPDTGRAVFVEMGCSSCRRVAWEKELPRPTASVEGPLLDQRLARLTPPRARFSLLAKSWS